MVIGAPGLVEVTRDDEPRREVGEEQADDVQRDDGNQPSDDARGHEVGHRRNAHHLERVDLLADAHGAELRREPRADRCRQCQTCDQRRDLAGVEVRRDEAGERRDADLVEALISLETHLGAGEERHERDDTDGTGDDRQRAGAQRYLRDQPEDFFLV